MKRVAAIITLCCAFSACTAPKPTTSVSPTASAALSSEAFVDRLHDAYEKEQFRVGYLIIIKAVSSNLTWSQIPPKRALFQKGKRSIEDGSGSTTVCSTKKCTTHAPGKDVALASKERDVLNTFMNAADRNELGKYRYLGERTVIKRPALCASWGEGPVTNAVCIDKATGVLLSWAVPGQTPDQAISWRIVAFGDPRPEDFEATVTK